MIIFSCEYTITNRTEKKIENCSLIYFLICVIGAKDEEAEILGRNENLDYLLLELQIGQNRKRLLNCVLMGQVEKWKLQSKSKC